MKFSIGYSLFFLLIFSSIGCSNDEPEVEPILEEQEDLIEFISIELNPTGYAPLSALLRLGTRENVNVEITVLGQNGDASSVVKNFNENDDLFELEVLGLYADYENTIEVRLLNNDSAVLETRELTLQTEPLISDLPDITIDVPSDSTSPEFNFVNYYGFDEVFVPQNAFMFDQFGDIRWYFDFASHPELFELFADNGMSRLENGNLIFGNNNSATLYEVDLLGNIINRWPLNGFDFHHHVIEKPNGNFLATATDLSKPTTQDVVIEVSRSSGEIINIWDLNISLDNTRESWPTNLANLDIDWFHANALEYSAIDDEIIISGRTQGVVKLNNENEISYIVGPHVGWESSGNGIELSQFLLTPLDAQGEEITDEDVLSGNSNHPDFEWAWYQHSTILLPNGNLMLFDNGENRNFVGTGPYSRAVEYEIDEENKTIKQVWTYGKERGEETYARIVSKVTFLSENNSVLFTPGSSLNNGSAAGKVIEVDYDTKQVNFEATIEPPQPLFIITFHNVLRMPLYN